MSRNDITLDSVRTHAPSPAYDSGYDRIFGSKLTKRVYKDTVAAKGSDLFAALEAGDMTKAEALYQESNAEYLKYNP